MPPPTALRSVQRVAVRTEDEVPRYLVEGEVTVGAQLPPADLDQVIERNLMGSVTWICSFVADRWTYALYEGPHPEAVRRAAGTSGLEVARVDEVERLDPYAYPGRSDSVPEGEEMR